MSGGFFRGTSADQDTRFSNKTAKLLKTQKFAPELDLLIDMTKVHLDSIRPWIATRVTQLLGFEDEVLINFIYGLLEGKIADGKQIQIQLTGFMEKNTGKFMKELWGLLTSAQNNLTGIPQQLLEEKAEEARLKKAEEHRVISEVRKKEEERRVLEQDMIKREMEDDRVDSAIPEASKRRSRSSSRGRKSPNADRAKTRNGNFGSRPAQSRSRSVSNVSSRSVSKSPPPLPKRRLSRSVSRSPPRRSRRSRSPLRRGRSPNHRRRSRSPLRRAWSPVGVHSPRRRRRSYSRSPRRRSSIPPRSPKRRRSPQASRSPRARSPFIRSPRRRHSPGYTRVSPRRRASPPHSPRRRASPPHSPRYRRRSPRFAHSPARRHYQPPSPGRRRYSPQRLADRSPRRRAHISPKAAFVSPRLRSRSSSAEAISKSPPQRRESSSSPHRPTSISPPPPMPAPSPPQGKVSFTSSPHKKRLLLEANSLRGSVSPVYQGKPANEYHSSRSPSPLPPRKGAETSLGNTFDKPVHSMALSLSPPKQERSPSSASPLSEKSRSRSPSIVKGVTRDTAVKIEQDFTAEYHMPGNRKRSRFSSRESSLPAEEEQVTLPKKPSLSDLSAGATLVMHVEKLDESLSRSFNDNQEAIAGRRGRTNQGLESDGHDEQGPTSPVSVDDRKAAKRRRKEERRLRKEEKRRKKEEKHKRKEERRANKALSKGIASVTPPPDFDKRPQRSDDFDSMDDGQFQPDEDLEIEQRKLENELRKKALDSIKAKKVVST